MAHDHRARIDRVLSGYFGNDTAIADVLPNHRWVWLTRRDKIAQAVSLSRAVQTGEWTSRDRDSSTKDIEFDYYHVLSRLMMIMINDVAWNAYFEAYNIHPYLLFYEEVFSDTQLHLRRLIEYLDDGALCLNGVIDTTATFSVQSDAVNTEWGERFRWYLTSVGGIDMNAEFGLAHQKWNRFFLEDGWR